MVHCLGQIFDSTVVQDRWLRPLANHGPRARSNALHTRADALGVAHPPAQKVLLMAMLPTCLTLVESLAGTIDGSSSAGSSDDDSSEQETESEPDSDSSDAD